jgi:hypothetical protein
MEVKETVEQLLGQGLPAERLRIGQEKKAHPTLGATTSSSTHSR